MSFLWLTLLSALRILRRNPLRAGLTMLGIIIGIGAVVAMVSLGQGATASVQAEISSLGTNVLIVVPGATTVGGVRGGLGSISTLTVDDAEDIEKKVVGVATVMYGTRSVLQVIRENKNWSTVVFGTTPVFPDVRNWPIAQGNFFTQSDLDSAAKVAVLGKTVVQNLFEPGEDVVGSEIRIRNVPLRIIGVLASKGQSITGQQLSFESRVEVSSCAAVTEQCRPQLVEDRQSPDRPGSPMLQHESAPPLDAKVFDA